MKTKRKNKLRDGDKIKITYLPPCRNGEGTANPYIGMSGTVFDLKPDGSFALSTGNSWLIVSGKKIKFERLSTGRQDLTETEATLLHKLSIARYIIGKVRSGGHTFDMYDAQIDGLDDTLNKYEWGN